MRVAIENDALAEVAVNDGYPDEIGVSKNTKVKATEGLFTFNDFVLTASPASTVFIKFTSDAIQLEAVRSLGASEADTIITTPVLMRFCKRGERIVDGLICQECPAGTYSLIDNSDTCNECL